MRLTRNGLTAQDRAVVTIAAFSRVTATENAGLRIGPVRDTPESCRFKKDLQMLRRVWVMNRARPA